MNTPSHFHCPAIESGSLQNRTRCQDAAGRSLSGRRTAGIEAAVIDSFDGITPYAGETPPRSVVSTMGGAGGAVLGIEGARKKYRDLSAGSWAAP